MRSKGISPIISVTLLLLVGVTSFVVLQDWYLSKAQSIYFGLTESEEIYLISSGAQALIGDSVYIETTDNYMIHQVKLGNFDCSISGTYSGRSSLNLSSCLSLVTTADAELVIFGSTTTLVETIIIDN